MYEKILLLMLFFVKRIDLADALSIMIIGRWKSTLEFHLFDCRYNMFYGLNTPVFEE